jgi:hypothetical protein
MTPAPPSPFPGFNTLPLKAGAQLFRFHDQSLEGAAYNPCRGSPTRFAPLTLRTGECLPTLYAATSLEAAAWESLFHDVPHTPGSKVVRLNKITTKVLSVVEFTDDRVVAPLHAPDLHRLGLAKTDLIETAPTTYKDTARWAEAFHRADPLLDGLRWTSRRCDSDLAFIFFEDRVPQTAWRVIERTEISTAPDLLEEIRKIGRRAEITLSL